MHQAHLQWQYNHAACGLVTFKPDGTIVSINQTLLKWLGSDEREFKKFTDILYKGGKLYFNLFVMPILQLHSKVQEISVEIQTNTGNFPALLSAVGFETDNREQLINAAIFKIDDRKKYEAELLKEKNLVKEENMAKSQILAEVAFNQAHLIRAPLANILGLINLLEEDKESDSENKKMIIALKASAVKLDSVVTEIVHLIH